MATNTISEIPTCVDVRNVVALGKVGNADEDDNDNDAEE